MKNVYQCLLVLLILSLVQFSHAQDWQSLNSGTTNQLRSVYFKNADTGFVVGAHGTLLKTVDGGLNWTSQSVPTAASFYSIHFPDPSNGYIAGDSGIILKTTDGGINWVKKYAGFVTYFTSVYFVNSTTGYAVGGKNLKTTDSGNTWNNMSLASGQYPESVYFTDSLTGYMAGSYYATIALILKTTNGGLSWDDLSVNGNYPLHSVFFPGRDTGIVVGGNYIGGTAIMRTTDEGVNWNTISSGCAGEGFASVFFIGKTKGYIVGESGVIKRSADAGLSWQNLYSQTAMTLFSVYFPDSLTGYAVGDSGTILKTINGGGVGIPERFNKNTLEIYPNPATIKINIKVNWDSPGEVLISIINSTGEQVVQKMFLNQNHVEMDVSRFSKGIYLVKIQTVSGVETKKVVIQ